MPTSTFCYQLHSFLFIHRQYRGNHWEDDHSMATLEKPCGGAEHFIHMDEVYVEAARVFGVTQSRMWDTGSVLARERIWCSPKFSSTNKIGWWNGKWITQALGRFRWNQAPSCIGQSQGPLPISPAARLGFILSLLWSASGFVPGRSSSGHDGSWN